ENVSDPGNLGTLARSALAFGFDPMLLSGACADPFSPKVIRASAGAVFALGVALTNESEVFDFVKQKRFHLVAADVKGESSPAVLRRRLKGGKLLLAVGSEAGGLSEAILRQAEYRICLEHRRSVESLNVAVAASILMKQVFDSKLR
ncbi:MAG: RNA methyltransferase, partial [candidate division Zixibacteria bacterium]|nr:RNA methyltransferase [candidate division Zixibacteria bacterium]